MARAKFHAMTEGTQEDWANVIQATRSYGAEFPDRLLKHLRLLEGDCGGLRKGGGPHDPQPADRVPRLP